MQENVVFNVLHCPISRNFFVVILVFFICLFCKEWYPPGRFRLFVGSFELFCFEKVFGVKRLANTALVYKFIFMTLGQWHPLINSRTFRDFSDPNLPILRDVCFTYTQKWLPLLPHLRDVIYEWPITNDIQLSSIDGNWHSEVRWKEQHLMLDVFEIADFKGFCFVFYKAVL